MSDWMVAFQVEVQGEDSPVDAARQARDKVGAASARVWSVPDDLDEDPQLFEITPEGEIVGQTDTRR